NPSGTHSKSGSLPCACVRRGIGFVFPTYIARFQLERTTPKKSGTDCGDSNAFRPFFQNRRPHRKSGGGVPCHVPGAGVEPARIAPLVFETSASTDSAIR